MELELKHLSAYLPYELSVLSGDSKVEYMLIRVDSKGTYHREVELSKKDVRYYQQNIKYCKPVLRPLSDLFKLGNDLSEMPNHIKPIEFLENYSDTDFERDFISEMYNPDFLKEKIKYAPSTILQKLTEWHFDIFGLIDAGLAVDINCL